MEKTPIVRAVEAAGGQAKLAEKIGVSVSAVNQWVHGLRPVPPARCLDIESAAGGSITRYDLRPDVFGEAAA